MHIIIFCLIPAKVVLIASARCKGKFVVSSGIWLHLKLCVCMPCRIATTGSILFILRDENHTTTNTVPEIKATARINGKGRNLVLYGIPVCETIIVFIAGKRLYEKPAPAIAVINVIPKNCTRSENTICLLTYPSAFSTPIFFMFSCI